jgi:hypothetical protein
VLRDRGPTAAGRLEVGTVAVAADAALAFPMLLVAVTWTSIVSPCCAEPTTKVEAVAPLIAEQLPAVQDIHCQPLPSDSAQAGRMGPTVRRRERDRIGYRF